MWGLIHWETELNNLYKKIAETVNEMIPEQ